MENQEKIKKENEAKRIFAKGCATRLNKELTCGAFYKVRRIENKNQSDTFLLEDKNHLRPPMRVRFCVAEQKYYLTGDCGALGV